MTLTYLRLELIRTYRNIRYLIFTLGVPVVLFLVIGGAFKGNEVFGVSGQTWYMINMAHVRRPGSGARCRRPDRDRARRRLEPAAAPDARCRRRAT